MTESGVRAFVRARANDRCEYCLLPQAVFKPRRFHVEHIIPKQHQGGDDAENLAFACEWCNLHKGPNLTGIDDVTRQVALLYNPRKDRWADHFEVREGVVSGRTPTGRASVRVMNMNNQQRVDLRREAGVVAPD